jgi:hypothetical protein
MQKSITSNRLSRFCETQEKTDLVIAWSQVTLNKEPSRLTPNDSQQFRALFPKIKSLYDQRPADGLICRQGLYNDCYVLKLQKAAWTNDRMEQLRNETGIFFSIWTNVKTVAGKNRANYNIHALKLRQLTGYSITSRDFANEFRKGFSSLSAAWPNVRVDYGPLTLMQGWIEVDMDRFEKDALGLMEGFKSVSPLIDRLLAARRK